MLNLHRFLSLVLVITACGAKQPGDDATDSASSGDTGDSDTTPTTGAAADPACACIDPAQFGRSSFICEAGPCDTVSLDCSDEEPGASSPACGSGVLVSLDEVALGCALDQLIAGTPGVIAYHESNITSSGGAFVAISASGNLMRHYSVHDLGGNEGPAGFVTLKDRAYFEGCKAETDAEARYLCFIQWTDDEPEAICDDLSELSSEF